MTSLVLILVVVEDGLVRQQIASFLYPLEVLILVVVEDGLVLVSFVMLTATLVLLS